MNLSDTVINTTTVYCSECHESHPATIETHDGSVIMNVACRTGTRVQKMSSRADVFLALRRKSAGVQPCTGPARIWYYFIELTQRCNFSCPVCFAGMCSTSVSDDMTVEAVVTLGRQIKSRGGRFVMLGGGEPTIHDDLPEIVRRLKRLGLVVEVATNGYRLGTQPGYADHLKRAGVSRVWLQLDTFDPSVHARLRNNEYIPEKLCAADNVIKAGIRLALIVTVTSLNLSSAGDILAYAIQHMPAVSILNFQVAADVGRYELGEETIIDREQIITELCSSPLLKDKVTPDNFWPVPAFAPWQLRLHPDCSANLFLAGSPSGIQPLDEVVDMPRLFDRLARNTMSPSFFNRNAVPAWYVLRSVRKGYLAHIARCLHGFITKRGTRGMLIVSVNNFLGLRFQDEERLARCAACHATADGMISACVYNHPDPRRPGSRAFWEKHHVIV